MALNDDGEIRIVGVRLTNGKLSSVLGQEILKALKYPTPNVKAEAVGEYVEPMNEDEEKERVKMERERDDLHKAGPSQVHRDKQVKIYKKLYYPTQIPDILEIKKVPIRVHAEEVRDSNEVLFKINRRFLSLAKGKKFCHLCNKSMNSNVCLVSHLQGKLHRDKVAVDLSL